MCRSVFKNRILYGLLTSLMLAGLGVAAAQMPTQADPGAVLWQNQREMWYRQNAPWLFGPITEEDFAPPEEPVIEFHEMEVQAEIYKQSQQQPEEENPYLGQ